MKTFIFLISFITFFILAPELSKVRSDYKEAAKNEKATKALYETLAGINKKDAVILVAYQGAVTTMMAKYAHEIKDKKVFFKNGRDLLEYAIEADPQNVEIHCLRLSVQENAPKIVGYKKNIQEDKQFILAHYSSMTDTGAKNFIKNYVLESIVFTDTEKQLF